MTNVKISLSSLDDIKEFNKLTCGFDAEADLTEGNYKVDAKSLIGLFTLDMNQALDLSIHSDNCRDYLKSISRFLVNWTKIGKQAIFSLKVLIFKEEFVTIDLRNNNRRVLLWLSTK